jgi:hypothetical protein
MKPVESMEPEEKCRLLAGKIHTILKHGLEISKDTPHFIDSTFSSPSPERLKEILSEETNGEVETLLSLIFFPDTATQLQLEDFLETGGFEDADEARVLKYLIETDAETPLRLPGITETFMLTMPPWAGEQFIRRLNISKRVDERLLNAVRRHVPEAQILHAKVKLRNSRFAETESRTAFLSAFFEKIRDDDFSSLGFLLAFFEEQTDHADIFEALIARKRHCFHSLQKAEKFEKMLRADNIETLMMRGVRMPYVDQEDMREKMAQIDRICLAIFGKTEYFQPPEAVLGLGDYHIL